MAGASPVEESFRANKLSGSIGDGARNRRDAPVGANWGILVAATTGYHERARSSDRVSHPSWTCPSHPAASQFAHCKTGVRD